MGEPAEVVIEISDARRDQFTRLLVLRDAPDSLDEWIFQLRDIPDDALEAAITYAIRTRVWFPVPAELRADADSGSVFSLSPPLYRGDEREREHKLAEPRSIVGTLGGDAFTIPIEREWRYDCNDCHDSGWADFWCGPRGEDPAPGQAPWAPIRGCDRRHDHAPHMFVAACACRETNPTIRRRNDAKARRFSEEGSKAK